MEFTELLYAKDEIIASLIIGLVFETNVNDCVSYIVELYNSGFVKSLHNLIWKIYFDFYFINNPDFATDISSAEKIEDFIKIIKNLFYLSKSVPVFLLHQHLKIYNSQQKIVIFRGKKPKWLENYNDISHKLLQSIEKQNWKNITYYIYILEDDKVQQVIEDVTKYLISKKTKIKINLDSVNYENKKHILLSLIVSRFTKITPELCVSINEKFSLEYDKYDYDVVPRKVLEKNRNFSILQLINAFKLSRNEISHKEHMDNYYYRWEYYCKDTPIWKKRFNEFSATFEDKTILFPSENYLEQFYDKYGLEPDEQKLEIIEKSHVFLEDISSKEFLSKLLENLKESNVDIPESMLEFLINFEDKIENKYII